MTSNLSSFFLCVMFEPVESFVCPLTSLTSAPLYDGAKRPPVASPRHSSLTKRNVEMVTKTRPEDRIRQRRRDAGTSSKTLNDHGGWQRKGELEGMTRPSSPRVSSSGFDKASTVATKTASISSLQHREKRIIHLFILSLQPSWTGC